MSGYFIDKDDTAGVRQKYREGYANAQRTGNGRDYVTRNADGIAAAGGYFANRLPGPGRVNVGVPTGRRAINSSGGYSANNSINFGAINAYNNSPAARAYMDAIGATPQYNSFTVSGPSGQTYGRTGGANPQTIRGSGGARSGGYGSVAYGGTPTNLNAHAPIAASPPQGAGGVGMAGGGGAAATGATPFGLSSGAASGLANTIGGALQQEIGNPSGLPVGAMRAESADSIGQSLLRQQQALREDFARRGQTGTAAEAAALRDLETRGQADRRSDFRDIHRQNVEAQLARRMQALGLGSNFLRNEQSFDLNGIGHLLGFFGA